MQPQLSSSCPNLPSSKITAISLFLAILTNFLMKFKNLLSTRCPSAQVHSSPLGWAIWKQEPVATCCVMTAGSGMGKGLPPKQSILWTSSAVRLFSKPQGNSWLSVEVGMCLPNATVWEAIFNFLFSQDCEVGM